MLDPRNPRGVLTWQDHDLQAVLPGAEDDRFEFKSSRVPDRALAPKVAQAASAFWNGGGGALVVGVDDSGRPDGGVACMVGRQARRDWFDQAIGNVVPRGPYAIQEILDQGAGLQISSGNAIYVIAFGESEAVPHMAADNVYYVRAGAHTVPASHFIVESLRARRGLSVPLLRATFRQKPQRSSVIQIGVIALNDAPALDVSFDFDPKPPLFSRVDADRLPVRVAAIDRTNPYYMDYGLMYAPDHGVGEEVVNLELVYRDLLGREYTDRVALDPVREMGPAQVGAPPEERMEQHLKSIEQQIKAVAKNGAAVADSLKKIALKLR